MLTPLGSTARSSRQVAVGLALAPSLVIGAVTGALASVFASVAAGAAAAVVLFGLVWALLWRTGAPLAIKLVGAHPAGPGDQPRLHNLVEGLCAASGLPKPAIYVVDDKSCNSFSVGRGQRHASIVVTTGLVETMSRVELEGVVAHELSHLKANDILASSVAISTLGAAVAILPGMVRAVAAIVGREKEQVADLAAVRLTRYPPGLLSALETMRDGPTSARISAMAARVTAHLWIAPVPLGRPAGGDKPAVSSLEQRIQALREL